MTHNASTLLEAAMAAHRRGDETAASDGYRKVLELQPKNSDALHLLGVIAARTDPKAGMEFIQRALAVNPASFEAHLNLAHIFARGNRMKEAALHFREAHNRRADNTAAAIGLGGALLQLGRFEEAERYLRKSIELDPLSAAALLNMAMLMDAIGRFEEALQYYDRVIALYPDHPEGHFHKALVLLVRGQFADGWANYVWRFKSIPTFFGKFNFPYWAGETLRGCKILVWTEQGPGDEILASTMIPELVAAGASVVLLCSARMAPLFARSFPSVAVVAAGREPSNPSILEGIALQASFSELGAACRASFSAFPSQNEPLKPDVRRTAELRQRYKAFAGENMLVGISWRSTSEKVADAKSIPLHEWEPILTCPGVTFLSLQYGDVAPDVSDVQNKFGVQVLVDTQIDPLSNLDDFAAQVAAMDLVISVSNTTVHMAGALGRTVWALIPTNHGRLWYWFLERLDSPWYASARLFRQDPSAGWQPVLASVAKQLANIRDRGDETSTSRPTS